MATRASKTATSALTNEQLALELTKVALAGSVRVGISDEVILNNTRDANKLALERARLDSAYVARLYISIRNRLDQQQSTASSNRPESADSSTK